MSSFDATVPAAQTGIVAPAGGIVRFRGPAGPDAVARHVGEVRTALQELIRQGLSLRRHVFF